MRVFVLFELAEVVFSSSYQEGYPVLFPVQPRRQSAITVCQMNGDNDAEEDEDEDEDDDDDDDDACDDDGGNDMTAEVVMTTIRGGGRRLLTCLL